ncbi:helix-turn-helix domain-containing protein [Modicisalibacter radicis]|uniref:helix-turn-helix domain-containing protein n=1 Tax=Halomonas sp. EAR18 TaxID=2518972 RepID=UPI00109D04E4|nr:helix-turn-helix transcriptional regulator [Halomonas sp. EAR18]
MSGIGDRLLEERKRLKLSQTALGEIGGVHSNAQRNYEKGTRSPDAAYLSAVAAKGVDVLYVLTGRRSATDASLTTDEAALLDNYRKTPQERRRTIAEVSQVYAAAGKAERNGETCSG